MVMKGNFGFYYYRCDFHMKQKQKLSDQLYFQILVFGKDNTNNPNMLFYFFRGKQVSTSVIHDEQCIKNKVVSVHIKNSWNFTILTISPQKCSIMSIFGISEKNNSPYKLSQHNAKLVWSFYLLYVELIIYKQFQHHHIYFIFCGDISVD